MEPGEDAHSVTRLLHESRLGDPEASGQLMRLVYDKLHHLALRSLRSERRGHTLQATALVHEAWLRLIPVNVQWQDRAHFYAVAARLMRRILVDYARAHAREKRGGGAEHVSIDDSLAVTSGTLENLLVINDALDHLGEHDSRRRDILELVLFGGLTYEETGAELDLSPATVHRELKLAKAWLQRELTGGQSASA